MYLALMIRQIIQAEKNPTLIDDRDFYGNKRLELAGSLMSLLFESLFKQLNSELKAIVEKKAYVDIISYHYQLLLNKLFKLVSSNLLEILVTYTEY